LSDRPYVLYLEITVRVMTLRPDGFIRWLVHSLEGTEEGGDTMMQAVVKVEDDA